MRAGYAGAVPVRRLSRSLWWSGLVAAGVAACTPARSAPVDPEARVRAALYRELVGSLSTDSTLQLQVTGTLRLLPDSVEWGLRVNAPSGIAGDSLHLAFRAGTGASYLIPWDLPREWSAVTPLAPDTGSYYACAALRRAGRVGPPVCTGPWRLRRLPDALEVRDWQGRVDTVRSPRPEVAA